MWGSKLYRDMFSGSEKRSAKKGCNVEFCLKIYGMLLCGNNLWFRCLYAYSLRGQEHFLGMCQCLDLCYCIMLRKNTCLSFWLIDDEKMCREVTQVENSAVRMWNILVRMWNTELNREKFFPFVGFCDAIANLYLVTCFSAEPSSPVNQWIEFYREWYWIH